VTAPVIAVVEPVKSPTVACPEKLSVPDCNTAAGRAADACPPARDATATSAAIVRLRVTFMDRILPYAE